MGLLILAVFFALATTSFGTPQQAVRLTPSVAKDCTYNVDKNVWVKTVEGEMRTSSHKKDPPDSNPPSYVQVNVPYQTVFGGKTWINIKNNVSIPRFKVWNGLSVSQVGREMDLIGTISENNVKKWVFVGLGHCKDVSDANNCTDPLTDVVIFVLQKKGEPLDPNMPEWKEMINNPASGVPIPPVNSDPEYWNFNVYLLEDILIANGGTGYTNADVPCWLAQCRGGDLREANPTPGILPSQWNQTCSELSRAGIPIPTPSSNTFNSTAVPLTESDIYPPSFIKRSWVDVTEFNDPSNWSDPWRHVQDYSWLAGKLTALPPLSTSMVKIGTVQGKLGVNDETYQVYAQRQAVSFYNSVLFLEPISHPTGFFYEYRPIQDKENVESDKGSTLKLGTIRSSRDYVYEWWYPSCKPALYLYPDKEKSFDISLKPFGFLTQSIPSYPLFGSWKNVLAKPNGQLTYRGSNYDYLYYEGKAFYVKVPPSAFTVKGSELDEFFTAVLPQLGLNEKELADFKQYWLARLNTTDSYYAISVLPREEIDRLETMEISPLPDTLIRVRLFIKKLPSPKTYPLPIIEKQSIRLGTTVVDWGGFYKD